MAVIDASREIVVDIGRPANDNASRKVIEEEDVGFERRSATAPSGGQQILAHCRMDIVRCGIPHVGAVARLTPGSARSRGWFMFTRRTL